MSNRTDDTERYIIYASFFIIVILSVLLGLSETDYYSIITIFMIVAIAISNIIYLYGKYRKKGKLF